MSRKVRLELVGQDEFLQSMGWSEFFERVYRTRLADEACAPGLSEALRARVIGEERGFYRLQLTPDTVVWGEISGKLRKAANQRRDYPAVGDWVLCSWVPGQDKGIVQEFLERRSLLVRKAAGETTQEQVLCANVDYAFVVTSANAELNLRRLERYLTLVADGGATPVVLLSKADLVADPAPLVAEIRSLSSELDVLPVSAKAGQGLEQLLSYMTPGSTSVMLGSSGVGKSTLVNRLLGRELLRTQETRAEDDKGRHTTTSRNLIVLETGALVIDTPGMRELHLTEAQEEGLSELFEDIEELGSRCKFNDCQHESEPTCAVKAAVQTGEVPRDRLAAYHKLKREIAALRRRVDPFEAQKHKAKWKTIHKEVKKHVKRKRGEP